MKSTAVLVAFSLLIGCPLFAQEQDSGPTAAASEQSDYGRYTSGFELPGVRTNKIGLYGSKVLYRVRSKWYQQILELQTTRMKAGTTVIELKIRNDGSLEKMHVVTSAGDPAQDAAASRAISAAEPFGPFPDAYREKSLTLRMHFGYGEPESPAAPACNGPNHGAHQAAYPLNRVGHGIAPPRTTYAPDPEYSETARREKYMSDVQIAGTVDPQGTFTDVCVTQAAGEGLDENAVAAVKTWKFRPATQNGEPVAVRLLVEVNFRLY